MGDSITFSKEIGDYVEKINKNNNIILREAFHLLKLFSIMYFDS